MISYAQNREDVLLWRALQHVKGGTYVDIGAAWPVQDSVTCWFYEQGWTGVNVEPNPALFEELRHQRPNDVTVCAAVSDNEGTATLRLVRDTGLSTLDSSLGQQLAQSLPDTHEITTEIITLANLWSTAVGTRDVHFLKIDVEGHEQQVIKGNDWERNRPWVVVVEAIRPLSLEPTYDRWEPLLVDARYLFVHDDGLNRYYVADEHPELLKSFRVPVNVLDGYTIAVGLAESQTTPAELASLRADLAARNGELAALREELRVTRHQLDAIQRSRFWRAMFPLRVAARAIRSPLAFTRRNARRIARRLRRDQTVKQQLSQETDRYLKLIDGAARSSTTKRN